MIGGNVIGFAVKQLSDNKIAGISLKCLKEFLPEVYSNKIMVSNIRKTAILHTSSLVERCNLDFFEKHLKQVLHIAGPRYVSELNKPRYSYAEGNYTLIGEQGTSFREIDLTALPYEAEKDAFRAKQIYYPFSRYRDFSDEKWFHKKDVTQYFESLFLQKYNSDKYMILQGYFHDREKNSPKYREVWVQIRSYFFGKSINKIFWIG